MSTSSGLYNSKTGERLPDSGGQHLYIWVLDGADISRFIKALHQRCWLYGLGWYTVGAAGQLLQRSIIDTAVAGAERLVFEANPVLTTPLAQDAAKRRPLPTDGELLDTEQACPDLSFVQQATLEAMMSKARVGLSDLRAKRRNAWMGDRVEELVRKGVERPEATKTAKCWADRQLLLPNAVLEFDDPALAGITVGDILNDPDTYIGQTLADPFEGVSYGRCKAKVLQRPDRELFINSFAHGHTVYELKLDYRAVLAMLERTDTAELSERYIELALSAHLDQVEEEQLTNWVSDKAGIGKRVLKTMLKAARSEHAENRQREAEERRRAERKDPRPQLQAPSSDAEWLPVVESVTEVLSNSKLPEPPMRDPDGFMVRIWTKQISRLRSLSAAGANNEPEATPLPAPEQASISRLPEPALAEMIEQHVEFVVRGKGGERPVHLHTDFVKHLIQRQDDLPVVTAISTLPIVLNDGSLLTKNGLNRDHGTVFRISEPLVRLVQWDSIPADAEIAAGMRFLLENWLVDVTADFAGKCILIACALTVVERVLLPERPAFFVTAGMRGGGKTTTLNMVSMGVLGQRAAAAAWSTNEEERRKALFSYLLEGVAFLVWDNLAKGALISCPHIEKALTAETFADRVLGESRSATPYAATVMAFTGNNVGSRGDLSSRSLYVQLPVNRPDPENRDFVHPDPIGWTLANRGRILAALYTILTGNPRRRQPANQRTPAPTRFKSWWELCGSAVEYAADVYQAAMPDRDRVQPPPFRFKDQFLTNEAADENVSAIVEVLTALNGWRPGEERFEAKDVVEAFLDHSKFRDALDMASGKPIETFSSAAVGWRLKSIRDAPALIGDKDDHRSGQVIAILRHQPPGAQRNDPAKFWVEIREPKTGARI